MGENEIKVYLQNENKSFDDGLKLFSKYSRNVCLQRWLFRKGESKMSKLIYELEKLSGYENLKVNKAVHAEMPKNVKNSVSDKVLTDNKETQFRSVKFEDLPEELKPVYNNIRVAYKFRRSYHEKLKLSIGDVEKAKKLAKNITTCDDVIKKGWKVIDNFKPGDTLDTNDSPKSDADHQTIQNNRIYVSRFLSDLEKGKIKPEKLDDRKSKVQERVDWLVKNKLEMKDDTKKLLSDAGINC